MELSLKSVILLSGDLLKDSSKFFIMKKSFNQDCLENSFAVLKKLFIIIRL